MKRGRRFNRVKRPKQYSPYVNFLRSKSTRLIGLHYKLQRLSLILGYTKERDDTWQAMSLEELKRHKIEWQKLSELFTPIRLEYNQKHYSKTFHREREIEGEINMSKMGFRDMMDWASENAKSDFKNVFIRFSEGVHVSRVVNLGNNPEYDNDIDRFFRSFRVHDMGQKSTFWSGLCLDYVMDNKQGIRKYLIQNKKLNKVEGEKIKTNGCVACVTLEVLEKEYGLERKDLNQILRTKTRVIMNLMYLRQALPDALDDRGKVKQGVVPSGLYVWEQSPSGFKKLLQSLERFVKLEMGDDDVEEEELLKYFEWRNGVNLAIGAEGEGVGKNSRDYTFEFKGKQGPLTYRDMPYGKEKTELLTYDPEVITPHNLVAIEAEKFITYQQMANKMLFLGDGKPTELAKIIHQCGYEIPGFEVSDNPLDDNYSQSFADKVLGTAKKKVLGINPVKNPHAEKARERKRVKEEEENEPWDDEEETPPTKKDKAKVTGKTLAHEEEEEEEVETPISKAKKKLKEQEAAKKKSKKAEDDEDEYQPITEEDEYAEYEADKAKEKRRAKKEALAKAAEANKKRVAKQREEEEDEEDFEATDDDLPWSDDDEDENESEVVEEEEEEKPKTKKKNKFEEMVEPSDEEEEEVRPKKKTGQNRKFF